ncbi:MAG: ACP S-malonyltransferase [Acidobacteria bacterium]|nr:ACP S-malonyltransferase [Acidobacteriota bacterium]
MGKIAFLFPGQASQYPGMGKDVFDRFPASAEVFKRADAALGFSLSGLCFGGTEEELKLTENTQPAILTVSVAVLQAVAAKGIVPDFVAGHSLGEYSALVAAGSLSFEDAVRTVRNRGRYMQEAVPVGMGAMAAVMGADLALVASLCDEVRGDQVLSAANINCPGQIVIAGHREAVERAVEAAPGKGAGKVVLLPVSAPFHCALMQPAADRLAADLKALAFADLRVPLVNNVDGRVIRGAEEARDGLVRQVVGSVLWQKTIELLMAEGVETFVEIGPRNVLAGMVKKINRRAAVYPVEKLDEVEELAAKIQGA